MRIILMDLPPKIKGFVSRVDDEETIVLNSRLSREANQETFKHELEHIAGNDFYRNCDVNITECIRHKEAK